MDAMRLEWRGDLRFVGTDAAGTEVTIDGGGTAGPGAADLLPLALAACLAHDVVEVMRKSRQEMTALHAEIAAQQEPDPPRAFVRIAITFVLAGHELKASAAERAIRLARKECPVLATISPDVVVEIDHRLEET